MAALLIVVVAVVVVMGAARSPVPAAEEDTNTGGGGGAAAAAAAAAAVRRGSDGGARESFWKEKSGAVAAPSAAGIASGFLPFPLSPAEGRAGPCSIEADEDEDEDEDDDDDEGEYSRSNSAHIWRSSNQRPFMAAMQSEAETMDSNTTCMAPSNGHADTRHSPLPPNEDDWPSALLLLLPP